MTHSLKRLSLALVSATIITVPALSRADSDEAYSRLAALSAAACHETQERLPGEDETACRERELASAVSRIDGPASSSMRGADQPLALGPPSPPTIRIIQIPLG